MVRVLVVATAWLVAKARATAVEVGAVAQVVVMAAGTDMAEAA